MFALSAVRGRRAGPWAGGLVAPWENSALALQVRHRATQQFGMSSARIPRQRRLCGRPSAKRSSGQPIDRLGPTRAWPATICLSLVTWTWTGACVDPIAESDGRDDSGDELVSDTGDSSLDTSSGDSNSAAESASSDHSSSDSASNCDVAEFSDPLVLGEVAAIEVDFSIARAVAVGGGVVVCGRGQLAWRPNASGDVLELGEAEFAGECRALVALDDDRVAVATDQGELLVVQLAAQALSVQAQVLQPEQEYYDLVLDGARLLVAAGTAGVWAFAVEGEALGEAELIPGAQDARALALSGEYIVVADGGELGDVDDPTVGGAALRVLNTDGGLQFEEVSGLGLATHVLISGEQLVVGRAGRGLEIYDFDGVRATPRSSLALTGARMDMAWLDESAGLLLVAGGSQLQLVDLSNRDEAKVVAREGRPTRATTGGPWFRGTTSIDGQLHASLGTRLQPVQHMSASAAPDIVHLEGSISFIGDNRQRLVALYNRGQAALTVTDVATQGPFDARLPTDLNDERPGCAGQFVIEPGRSFLVELDYDGSGDAHEYGSLTIASNDPDTPSFAIEVEAGRPTATAGDRWRDFSLLTVDGSLLESSAWRTRVILAKLYNFT